MLASLIVREPSKTQSAFRESFQQIERTFVTASVADMDAVWFQRRAESFFEQRGHEAFFRSTLRNHAEVREQCFGIGLPVRRRLASVERSDFSGVIEIPEASFRCRRYHKRTVRCDENLWCC